MDFPPSLPSLYISSEQNLWLFCKGIFAVSLIINLSVLILIACFNKVAVGMIWAKRWVHYSSDSYRVHLVRILTRMVKENNKFTVIPLGFGEEAFLHMPTFSSHHFVSGSRIT